VLAIFSTADQLSAQSFAKVNINNVSTFVWNDGKMDYGGNSSLAEGFEYWKGTKRFSVYSSGVYWGGYIDNELRVGGTRYNSSLIAGNENGFTKIYRVRPDFVYAKLNDESVDEGKSEEDIKAQYLNDYENWPVKQGAPFNDVNKDGRFTKGIDIPGFPNADQTLWQMCNDFVTSKLDFYYNPFYSNKTSLEVQITTWAYSKYDLLKGVIFKSYKLINKSKTHAIKEMYLGIFSDPDLGDAIDDFAGCDTTLNLAYVYNSKANDSVFGENLTSFGSLLLQSPIINSASEDIAVVNGKKIHGMKNIGMSSFVAIRDEIVDSDGTTNPIRPYNQLRGLTYYYARPSYDPILKRNTKFPLSGDPVTKNGFVDGILNTAGDRFIQSNSGPINMAPGDTQEVIFAQIVTSSTSRLGSISYLKYLAKYVKNFYENEMFAKSTANQIGTELPTHFSLEQNFPNPFNPETTISYSIPQSSHVTLKVYDVLGREIATLVDELKQAGTYKSQFSIGNFQLSSGVYFYRIQANGYSETKKMMLIK